MKRLWDVNWAMVLPMLALIAVGAVFIKSSGEARDVEALHVAWKSHLVTAVAGLGLYATLAALDYRRVLTWSALPFLVASVALLVAVLMFGSKIYGGRRWLWFFQPSELAKLAVIMAGAQFFGGESRWSRGWRGLVSGLALLCVPAALILKEPDLGTALVLVPTVLAMMLAARVCRIVLVPILAAVLAVAALTLGAIQWAETRQTPEARAAAYARIPLMEHQKQRLKVFLFPDKDPFGGGWNLRQAKISIGSGSLRGKGIGRGDQKFLGYLPPSVSMNDFIFAVLAEETGFAGSAATLLLFLALLLGGAYTAARAADDCGRLLAIGVSVLVFSHVYVNVAMSIGLMPITGLPLPFISAGKSFLVVLMAALGLVQSVNIHKQRSEECWRK